MTDLVTIAPDALAKVPGPSDDSWALIWRPGGPLTKIEWRKLLAKLVAADAAVSTYAVLSASLLFDEGKTALVHSDPDPLKNGWYRKTGASGGGAWVQFEQLAMTVRADAMAALAAAQAARDLAGHYANDAADVDVPGGAAGERGAKYWAQTVAGLVKRVRKSTGLAGFVDQFGRIAAQVRANGQFEVQELVRPTGQKVYAQLDQALADSTAALAAAAAAGISANKQALVTAIRNGYDVRPYLAGDAAAPTITVGANNAASTISGAVAVEEDSGKFQYFGGVPYRPSNFPASLYYRFRAAASGYTDGTNTTVAYSDGQYEVEFRHNGTALELMIEGSGGGYPSWLIVDGRATSTFTVVNNTGGIYPVRVEFATAALRTIRLVCGNAGFGGVRVANAAEISNSAITAPIAMSLGDSFWGGAGESLAGERMASHMARALGFNLYNGGVGSTGVVQQKGANNSLGQPLRNYVWQPRLDLFCNPAALIGFVPGSGNDNAVAGSEWPAGAATLEEAVFINCCTIADAWFAVNGGKPLIFLGPTTVSGHPTHQQAKNRDAMHQAALVNYKRGGRFVDLMQPTMIPYGTSAATFNTGAPGQTGGADGLTGVYTWTDGAHSSPAGHRYRGRAMAHLVRQSILAEWY